MRGQLTVGNTIVREIRPADVIRACNRLLFDFKEGDSVTDEQWSKALFTDSDLIEGEINDEVNSAFTFVNRAYSGSEFHHPKTDSKSTLSYRRVKNLHRALMTECAVLVSYNYQDVSFQRSALECLCDAPASSLLA
jgi:hypothetical protein